MRRPLLALTIFALSLSAQAAGVEQNALTCAGRTAPQITLDTNGEAHLDVDVLLYNVEGLPFPARMNREPQLEQIAAELAALRSGCSAPHIVVLQEAFSETASEIGRRAGYPYRADGPDAAATRQSPAATLTPAFLAERSFAVGERAPKLINAGLQVLSEFPIVAIRSEPFSPNACAGTDCLSNKGAMLVRLQIPGLPQPVEILNTHMNSRKGAGVPYSRSDQAHHYQADELAAFLARARTPGTPLLIAGDFNTGSASARFAHLEKRLPQTLVHRSCTRKPCELGLRFETDTPWMETHDLQAFEHGLSVGVRPLKLGPIFDGNNRPVLSDHIGTIVTYRLTWRQDPTRVRQRS